MHRWDCKRIHVSNYIISNFVFVHSVLYQAPSLSHCCRLILIKVTPIYGKIFAPLGLSGQRGIVVPYVCPSEVPSSSSSSKCMSVCPSVSKIYLVRMITRHRFELESLNLQQTCILGYFQLVLVLKMEVIDLDLQGHFGHFDSEF